MFFQNKFVSVVQIILISIVLISCAGKKKIQEIKEDIKQEAKAVTAPTPPPAPPVHHSHWSYEGETGPDHWGSLESKFATCSDGQTQSPINLKWNKPEEGGKLEFAYKDSNLKVIDNGHTLQFNYEQGSKVSINGEEYDLLQMHFHTPSEHTIANKSFPLEVHFVHKDALGRLAVVGVMFKESKVNDPTIDALWGFVPSEKNKEMEIPDFKLNPMKLIPSKHTFYHYSGSLTTPPCTEGVNWNVLNTPINISKSQIDAFRSLYNMNSRPVQPLNGRKVVNY